MLSVNAILQIVTRIVGLFFHADNRSPDQDVNDIHETGEKPKGLFTWESSFNLNQFVAIPDCPKRPSYPEKPKTLEIVVEVPGGFPLTYSTLEGKPCPVKPFVKRTVNGQQVLVGMHIQLNRKFQTPTMQQCYCGVCKPLTRRYHRMLKPAHQQAWNEWKVAVAQFKVDLAAWKPLAAARKEAVERLQVLKLVRAQARVEKTIEDKEMRKYLSRHNDNFSSASSTTMESVMRRDGFIGTTKSGRTGVVHYRVNAQGERVVATIRPLTAKKS